MLPAPLSATPLALAVLPGDGIGPEIVVATRTVVERALEMEGVAVDFCESAIGFPALEQHGSTFPDAAFATAAAADGVILGPVSHMDYPPVSAGGVNPSGALRRRLDLFANVRPARTLPSLPTPTGRPMDLVIVRENTEGFYADRTMHEGTGEFMPTPDLAIAMRKVTREGSLRIAEHGFALARARRSKVTVVHKANVLRTSDGLFLEATRSVAARHPDVEYEEQLVDAMAALLIRRPEAFDVIVTTNMFGDILSDEATELAGGLGLAASINAGSTHCVAQAQHGSAPSLAGLGVANPCSLIGSAGMLLDWLGRRRDDERLVRAGDAIAEAIELAVARPETRTRDLGGHADTTTMTAAILAALAR